jgi:hypothetical protein
LLLALPGEVRVDGLATVGHARQFFAPESRTTSASSRFGAIQ